MSDGADTDQSIAIIGMAGRFPGAPDLEIFWQNLSRGVESISFFSDAELLEDGVSAADLANPNYVKAASIIPGAYLFDAEYFNYSPAEADFTDPQQRIFLECALEALESAGCNSLSYPGVIGVFAGSALNLYQYTLLSAYQQSIMASNELRTMFLQGNEKDYLATRVSYKLGLRGPSVAVQTACSTSLVAVHLACQSLLTGECEVALAGAVSVISSYRKAGYLHAEGGIQSPDGHCRPFDAAARGTIFGDGVGVVVLKKLDQALADGDKIRAIIRGSAINNDGSGKVGFTAPSVDGQAAVVAEAIAVAGIDRRSIDYIETHGTGTELGDPIEIAALANVFRGVARDRKAYAIGSVKSNIGHLNTASGMAGLIKVVLSLEHRQIPPSLNFEAGNPKIDFANSPFFVNTELLNWESGQEARRAGVSSFGFGGTNAHLIVEEAPALAPDPSRRLWHPVVMTARTLEGLEAATENITRYLETTEEELADIAYTLCGGRRMHKFARVVTAGDRHEAAAELRSGSSRCVSSGQRSSRRIPVHFMFPGQASQRLNMGSCLYRGEKVFRQAVADCSELLRPHLNADLRDIIFADADTDEARSRLTETAFAQPAIFTISFALARLWMSWGVVPEAMIGHSIGELVAACLAEVFSLEDALAIVAARGQLMQRLPRGAMIAVVGKADGKTEKLLANELSLAAVNGPDARVFSGEFEPIARAETYLSEAENPFTRLATSHAFHSSMMIPAVDPFVKAVAAVKLKRPAIRFISNITGTWITETQATDPNYWGQHILRTVKFSDGIRVLAGNEACCLLEVGPGQTLSKLAASSLTSQAKAVAISSLPFSKQRSEMQTTADAAVRLWFAGADMEWSRLYAQERRRKAAPPVYPFDRKSYAVSPAPVRRSESLFYLGTWKRAPLAAAAKKNGETKRRNWIVFAGDDRVSAEFSDQLRSADEEAVIVSPGKEFSQLAERHFTASPARPEHFTALFRRLRDLAWVPDVVVYLWSVLPNAPADGTYEEALDLAFYGPIHLLQAVGLGVTNNPLEVVTVVADSEDVLGGERVVPLGSVTRGPSLVGPIEYENVRCRLIDLSSQEADSAGFSKTVARMIDDLDRPSPDGIIAYRHHKMWLRSVSQITLDPVDPSKLPVRDGGTYLITGGLGDVGLAMANALADRAPVKLVLVSRSIPAVLQGAGSAEKSESSERDAGILQKLEDIRAKGAEVLVGAADVAHMDSMQRIIKQARERFGEINGVFHAAGVAGQSPIGLKTRDEMGAVLRPKITGTLVLDELFRGSELDFLVLFSSISALMGGAGQADYAAGNAFMDAFAQSKTSSDTNVISINWGPWSEIGMAAKMVGTRRIDVANSGLKTVEAANALFQVLSSGLHRVGVIKSISIPTGPANGRQTRQEAGGSREITSAAGSHSRPALASEYVAPRSELEGVLARFWCELFSLDSVGVFDDFFELGGDSLLGLRLLPRIRNHFQVELTPRDLFTAPTIDLLARLVEDKLIAEIEQMADADIED
jgi:phthiocerol/phenolphthiocerol synthesis type-I polyketide synthase E